MLCRRLRGADERPPHEYYASCVISTKYRVVLCTTRVERAGRAAVAAAGQLGQQCQTRGPSECGRCGEPTLRTNYLNQFDEKEKETCPAFSKKFLFLTADHFTTKSVSSTA